MCSFVTSEFYGFRLGFASQSVALMVCFTPNCFGGSLALFLSRVSAIYSEQTVPKLRAGRKKVRLNSFLVELGK